MTFDLNALVTTMSPRQRDALKGLIRGTTLVDDLHPSVRRALETRKLIRQRRNGTWAITPRGTLTNAHLNRSTQ